MDEGNSPPIDEAARQRVEEDLDRMAQPVDAEQPPRLPFPVVGIGASAGGLEAVREFLDALPSDSGMALVLVQHLPPDRESLMVEILAGRTAMPVRQVEDGMAVEPDHFYVIRPGHVLTIREGRLHLGPKLGTPRAANRPIDDFFRSLAEEQRERAIAVVMSGMGSNGTAGTQAIKAVGGLCIAQEPESALFPSMPRHLIDAGYADSILRPAEMPEVLLAYAGHPYARGGREADAGSALQREGHHLREILAVLRTRARQDFTGYKKPTLLRRVQRRMGLTRVGDMAEYARLLRRNPSEVTALADDLLIHVTGFFRDPEAWESLRREVIVPLVNARESGAEVRGWVTACSSGEEAYTLAMLLVEESERAAKRLDIKIFATDLANRSLAHARSGIYPGGIESEINLERLERFFDKDDAVYQVRPSLRDRVVFAPQNVLQDPPFSRLDIVSCRNLLIYLEPDVQQRVLSLLHFGLREGGALFLGSSEAVANAEGMFETIDKRARIFRRVGPTRHGSADFPLPHAILLDEEATRGVGGGASRQGPQLRQGVRPSLEQLTRRVLLEDHTPPAVTVDRDHRILYYHGDTRPYLQQPSGEPTRDLMLLAREGLRASVRMALHRASAGGVKAFVDEGWIEVGPGRRLRVAIVASPVVGGPASGEGLATPAYFILSFEERGDFVSPPVEGLLGPGEESSEELRRLRAELQSTIEELQTSNEELRASNEEVMSVNEEYQSANEELETSREEMQSLNEELTTVNSQLRAKVEEHQAASSDLTSLLASTDIAVLFLDTAFRIRRYTPAIRDLVDMIATDVGRPLSALARRFDDPRLDDDARSVLERLVPIEREVSASDGRHFLRRVLPYRTTDNRIDGVVLTFVDITPRKRAELALREREAWLRGQREALEDALNDAPLEASLGFLTRTSVDALGEGTQAAFYLAEGEGQTLNHVVGMPDDYAEAINGFKIGPESLACDLATHTGQPVLTADVTKAALWEPWRWLAARFDFRGCWSFPIHTSGGKLVGSFAVYSRRPREATKRDLELASLLVHTASIIISRHEESRARRRAEEALRASEERLRAVAANLPSGAVFVIDADLRYVLAAGEALGPAGLIPSDLEGRAVTEVIAEDLFEEYEANYRRALAGDPFQIEHTAHGRLYVTHGVPLRDEGGTVSAVLAVSYDITDRKRAEAELSESKDRLNLALSAARMGIWHWDVADDIHNRDANLNRLLGLEPVETRQPFAEFLSHIHPDDREAVAAAFDEAVRRGQPLNIEFRVTWTSGEVRWLRDQGDTFVSAGEGTSHMTGACVDITDLKEAEAALRGSEERLRLIIEGATDYAFLTIDVNLRVDGWSPGAAAVFGYPESEILGQPVAQLYTMEDRAAGAPEAEARQALAEGRSLDERWHLRRDGSRFYASGVLFPLGGSTGGFVKIARDLTERKRMEDELRRSRDELEVRVAERTADLARANTSLKELLRRLVTAQEDERRRVARDLHDVLGQELTALILGLKALERAIPPDAPGRDRLLEVEETAGRIGREAHDLAVELRPTALDDIGVGPALAAYIARWSERYEIAADFQTPGLDGGRLPPEVETTVYRIVQEALNNVAKHAHATRVSVILERRGDEVTALVEDDGRGFESGRVQSEPGRRSLGLIGMLERVNLVGGTLLVESGEHEGTTIRARIPLQPQAGEADHGG